MRRVPAYGWRAARVSVDDIEATVARIARSAIASARSASHQRPRGRSMAASRSRRRSKPSRRSPPRAGLRDPQAGRFVPVRRTHRRREEEPGQAARGGAGCRVPHSICLSTGESATRRADSWRTARLRGLRARRHPHGCHQPQPPLRRFSDEIEKAHGDIYNLRSR